MTLPVACHRDKSVDDLIAQYLGSGKTVETLPPCAFADVVDYSPGGKSKGAKVHISLGRKKREEPGVEEDGREADD